MMAPGTPRPMAARILPAAMLAAGAPSTTSLVDEVVPPTFHLAAEIDRHA